MGRGVAYPYEEFVLIDETFDAEALDLQTEEDYLLAAEWQMDESAHVLSSRGGKKMDRDDQRRANEYDHVDWGDAYRRRNEAILWYEFDRFMVGFEAGDGLTCLFVLPMTYERRTRGGHVVTEPYSVARDAARLFNALHRALPGRIKVATSAWTTTPYRRQKA